MTKDGQAGRAIRTNARRVSFITRKGRKILKVSIQISKAVSVVCRKTPQKYREFCNAYQPTDFSFSTLHGPVWLSCVWALRLSQAATGHDQRVTELNCLLHTRKPTCTTYGTPFQSDQEQAILG